MTMDDRFAEIHPPFAPQEALVEANRCLFCFDAPCTGACPTHIDVPRFIKKISTGNVMGSADTILSSNILGLSCSRVCPVEVLCEGACVMHRYNKQPIEIGRLQRFAMDRFYGSGAAFHNGVQPSSARVACIGGGPASLSCAAELRRNGVGATIHEKRPLAGGLNTYGVAQYKLTPADSLREVDLVKSLGVEFVLDSEVGSQTSMEAIEASADAVFIGIGLGPTISLGVDGETQPGVVDALQFIADYKTGKPVVGSRVVVVGGGNTAIDAAVAALRLGAEECSLIYRRSEQEMPAFRFEFERAKQEGVQFIWQTLPVAVAGNGRVEGVDCMRMELGPPDKSGRRAPQPVDGSNFRVPCDMVILSIGQSKLLGLLRQFRGIGLENGRVVVNAETGQTANPRYFAGGDCVNGGREVVDAVAEGKRAARGILAWLSNGVQHG
jgi:dihydropyrimidine dehydrogenase (NAD+) subunit PreT